MSECRTYWGTHGCVQPRGHGEDVPHECDCCDCPDHAASNMDADGVMCVGKPPYYGAATGFYGEDVTTAPSSESSASDPQPDRQP